jgi:hypothetical protein
VGDIFVEGQGCWGVGRYTIFADVRKSEILPWESGNGSPEERRRVWQLAQARHAAGARGATPRQSSAASAHMPELTRHHRGHGAPQRWRWHKPTVCCESWHLLSDIFVGNARGDLPALRDDQAAARDETMSSQDVLFLGCFFKFEKKKKKWRPRRANAARAFK